jgi:hypothetical protein
VHLLPAPNADLGLVRGHGSASAGKEDIGEIGPSCLREKADLFTWRIRYPGAPIVKAEPRRAFMASIHALAAVGTTHAAAQSGTRMARIPTKPGIGLGHRR